MIFGSMRLLTPPPRQETLSPFTAPQSDCPPCLVSVDLRLTHLFLLVSQLGKRGVPVNPLRPPVDPLSTPTPLHSSSQQSIQGRDMADLREKGRRLFDLCESEENKFDEIRHLLDDLFWFERRLVVNYEVVVSES